MWRKKKNKFKILIKNFSNNLWIVVLILLVWFFGGNFVLKKIEEAKKAEILKQEIIKNKDKEKTDNQDKTPDDYNKKFWIDRLKVEFSLEEKTAEKIAIVWKLSWSEVDSIEVLTCRDNFSPEYDKSWYKLSSYKKWKEDFEFNTMLKFWNRCDIPYKFKFGLDWHEKVFSFDAGFDSRAPLALFKVQELIKTFWEGDITLEKVDNFNYRWYIEDKATCLETFASIPGKNTFCSDPDLVLTIEKITDDISEIKLKENIFAGQIYFDKFYDINYNKLIYNNTDLSDNFRLYYKQDGDLFLSNLFVYNEKYWELTKQNKTITADFKHFYYKDNWIYFVEDLEWNFRYWIKNISEDEISPNIKIENNYIVILEKLDNNKDYTPDDKVKIYYWEIFPWRNSIDLNIIEIKAETLWCGEIIDHDMENYVDIMNWKIITKSSCALELENPEFIIE
jgi:hypothetical protein